MLGTLRTLLGLAVASTFIFCSTSPRAEVGFSCPKPGTVAQYENGRVEYVGIRDGDPYNCLRIGITGKQGSLLVNFYAVSSEDYPTVKKAMVELLSKRAPAKKYVYTAVSNRNQYLETWKFLQKETISVGGRSFDADVYERDEQGQLGNSHHSIWTFWLDPRTGIWLKNKVAVVGGTAQGLGNTAGELLSVTEP